MRSIWKGHIRFLLVAIPVRIYNAIETSEIRSIVERARYLFAIHKTDDVDRLGRFDLDLGDVLRFDDRVAIGLVLVALRDLVVADDFVALLAALVVADWTKIVAVQLVELNLLAGFDSVVDAYRDGNQQEPNVTLPDGPHMYQLLLGPDYATDCTEFHRLY